MGKQYRDQEFLIAIGKRLVKIRESKNMTQEKLQEISGIDIRQIGRIERAESNTSISILKQLADILEIKLSELVDV
ncbi:helix-turn-helix domain-containing protein [Pedobacter sp. AW1-32]|uniref:helix-turn-helix domain-containing protein n=1 Tax=Pedobacter sp. AW1-32 TaxID=3383026 RepID=UPI003FEE1D15